MGDARYPAEKLHYAILLLVRNGSADREAMEGALGEYNIAFGARIPEWAREGVDRMEEAAPFRNLTGVDGSMRAWVRSATEVQLSKTAEALLDLCVTVVEENARQAASVNAKFSR